MSPTRCWRRIWALWRSDERLGAPDTGEGRTAIIDFGGPNVAKPMHVGHLRSSIIGDCLQRLYRANGWRVVSDVHLGDWGLQMGQLITEVESRGIAPVYFDAAFKGPYPEQSPVTMDDLEEMYPAASAACKADPARLDAARRATVDIAGWPPRLSRLVAAFRQSVGTGPDARIRQPGREVRSVERRMQRA